MRPFVIFAFSLLCPFRAYSEAQNPNEFVQIAHSKLRTALVVKGLAPQHLKVSSTNFPEHGYFQYRAFVQAQFGSQTKHFAGLVKINHNGDFEPVVLVEMTSVSPLWLDELPRMGLFDRMIRGGLKGFVTQLEQRHWFIRNLYYARIQNQANSSLPHIMVVVDATKPARLLQRQTEQIAFLTVNQNTFELEEFSISGDLHAVDVNAFMEGSCSTLLRK